jgi:hypothetical protein
MRNQEKSAVCAAKSVSGLIFGKSRTYARFPVHRIGKQLRFLLLYAIIFISIGKGGKSGKTVSTVAPAPPVRWTGGRRGER